MLVTFKCFGYLYSAKKVVISNLVAKVVTILYLRIYLIYNMSYRFNKDKHKTQTCTLTHVFFLFSICKLE